MQCIHLKQRHLDIRGVDKVLFDRRTRLCHDGCDHSILHEVVKRKHRERCECRDRCTVQLCHFGKVLCDHAADSEIHLHVREEFSEHIESISMLPISRLLHHLLNHLESRCVLGDALMEQIDIQDEHPNVHLHILGHFVFDALLVDIDCICLVSDFVIIVSLGMNSSAGTY